MAKIPQHGAVTRGDPNPLLRGDTYGFLRKRRVSIIMSIFNLGLGKEIMPIFHLSSADRSMVDMIFLDFTRLTIDFFFKGRNSKWSFLNLSGPIINVDGSCFGNPSRNGFGDLIQSSNDAWCVGFSSSNPSSIDILYKQKCMVFIVWYSLRAKFP